MVDLDALREALATFEVQWSESLGAHTIGKQTQFTIAAAAREFLRLMETVETVWWCQEHNKPALLQDFPNPSVCTEQSKWCRMVEAVLTRRDTDPVETELDRNQMGIW